MFTFSTAGRVIVGAGVAPRSRPWPPGTARAPSWSAGTTPTPRPVPCRSSTTPSWCAGAASRPSTGSLPRSTPHGRCGPTSSSAWGGGSVIDLAKAVGVLLHSEHGVLDHLEVIGAGMPLPGVSTPVIAVPTTAGTGAEVTANAPVLSPEHGVKASLRSPAMMPAVAVVDPELTLTCPPDVTASSGLDALTQCLEPFTSIKANPISDALAREGLARAASGPAPGVHRRRRPRRPDRHEPGRAAVRDGAGERQARRGARPGRAAGRHDRGRARPGLRRGAGRDHRGQPASAGAARARVTGAGPVRRGRAPAHRPPRRRAADAVAWIRETVDLLGVPSLGALGLERADHARVADAALVASSMAGNPVRLTRDEVLEILDRSA